MKVSSTVNTTRYKRPTEEGEVKIEFAIPSEGGNSSAGEKYNFTEKSVRLAWWSSDGRFDPVSSGELPEWAMMDVIEACAVQDFFSAQQASMLIRALSESLVRQLVD
jgi:hypothetical protein